MTAEPGARSLRICIFGDSIAAGTGDERCLGWHGRLAARLIAGGRDVTVYPLGVRGDTSEDVARRWRAEAELRLPPLFPAAVVFQFGLNDCAVRTWADGRIERRVSPQRTVAHTREILTRARASYATLMIGPAPVDDSRSGPQLVSGVRQRLRNEDIADIDVRLRETAADAEVPYLPVFEALAADAGWQRAIRLGDAVHPTGEGYDALAEQVAGWSGWRALLDMTNGAER